MLERIWSRLLNKLERIGRPQPKESKYADEQQDPLDYSRSLTMVPPKAGGGDFLDRFREVISDPINLLIDRVPMAGVVEANQVYLHNGNRVPVTGEGAYSGSFSQLLVINRGVHEPLEEYVFQELMKRLPDVPVMVEVGANWGHYSMWLKRLKPASTVILIEPEQAYLAAGINNFARNGLKGEFIQAFVGNGHLQIDAFLQGRALERLDILHADIQGYEAEMIEGCSASLNDYAIDYLFISTHSQHIHGSIVSSLRDKMYRIEVSSDFDNETTSYDGFVFASSPRTKQVFDGLTVIGRTSIAKSRPADLLKNLLGVQRASGEGMLVDRF
jgi:hypothetical protein